MVIQPGVGQPSVVNMIELVRTNSLRRVDVELQDLSGAPVDIDATYVNGEPNGELDLEITDIGGQVIYKEAYWPPSAFPVDARIRKSDTGRYFVKYGTSPDETARTRSVLFNWHSRQNITSEDVYRTQVVDIVSPRTLSLLPQLRLYLDKSLKPVLPEKYCFIGWTDGMLAMCLKQGLHLINEYEPYPCFSSLDYFPMESYSNVLLKAAIYQGVTSQLLFAIDTDVPNYSDSGHSFVLQHGTPLAAYLSHLKQELDKIIPLFKLKFVNSGTISVEARMDMAFSMLLATAPGGSLFRNMWASG